MTIWLLGTLGVLVKHVVLFHVWTLYVYSFRPLRRAILAMGATGSVFLCSMLPYASPAGSSNLFRTVLTYSGGSDPYGLGLFLPRPLVSLLFYGGMVALPIWALRQRWSLIDALLATTFAFFVLAYGFSYTMAALLLIVGSLRPGVWLLGVTAIALAVVALGAHHPFPAVMSLFALAALWQLIRLFRRRARLDSSV